MSKVIRPLLASLLLIMASLLPASAAQAATATPGVGTGCQTGGICAEVRTDPHPHPGRPGSQATLERGRPGHGEATSGGGSAAGAARPAGEPRHPGLTYDECVAFLQFSEDRSACQPAAPTEPAAPVEPGSPAAPPVTVVVDPATVAQSLRNEVPVVMPRPHTSPPEGGFQLTGLETWYWLDAEAWEPVSVRAEVPGVWVEVTATPTTATWEPGDGSATVVCTGPSRPHPGTTGATTGCGHTYIDTGRYTITASVRFAVTWEASTGEGGDLDPITLSRQLPIEVEQRQVVIDG